MLTRRLRRGGAVAITLEEVLRRLFPQLRRFERKEFHQLVRDPRRAPTCYADMIHIHMLQFVEPSLLESMANRPHVRPGPVQRVFFPL
jgi:hypothetical protein